MGRVDDIVLTMKMVEEVEKYAMKLGVMKYDGGGWEWEEVVGSVTKKKGIYFLVSEHGIEKVGSARGKYGLRGRLQGYCRKKVDETKRDSTDMLWERVMEGELRGERISVYCLEMDECIEEVETKMGVVRVEYVPVLEVEAYYFREARLRGEPMRLSGTSA